MKFRNDEPNTMERAYYGRDEYHEETKAGNYVGDTDTDRSKNESENFEVDEELSHKCCETIGWE